ncbi:MAG: DUF1972 domain-containing protein [Immundisolibacteraceae bacterium]|nr:DUF1972 domain-containing protein [Immundisolibacteraceae bacterium]
MKISILGTRGVPANHGGFETLAEKLSLYLCKEGWDVTVYCQNSGSNQISETEWNGIRLVEITVPGEGPLSTILFDWKATLHSLKERQSILTLGYNTALFGIFHRLFNLPNVLNMDGVEWKRKKWSAPARLWFRLNERIGARIATHLIADHPGIADHLTQRYGKKIQSKLSVIPYGADQVDRTGLETLTAYGLTPGKYVLIIARPEPENSILEMVRAYASQARDIPLVVLGNYSETHPYHRAVLNAATDEVRFLGAIYDREKVQALRRHTALYLHGHQVGGTNPSLVEALGCGNPVLSHDNPFNRWVAGNGNYYFNEKNCASVIGELLGQPHLLTRAGESSLDRFNALFQWPPVLESYRKVLESCVEQPNKALKNRTSPGLWPSTLSKTPEKNLND